MADDNTQGQEQDPAAILEQVSTIALVGASPKPQRPSNEVMKFLLERGYEVIPLNPGLAGERLLGKPVFASLSSLPAPVDMIDIFRNAEAAGKVVDEALALPWKPRVIWMQLGITNEKAAQKARAAGITVIMNNCPKMVLES